MSVIGAPDSPDVLQSVLQMLLDFIAYSLPSTQIVFEKRPPPPPHPRK